MGKFKIENVDNIKITSFSSFTCPVNLSYVNYPFRVNSELNHCLVIGEAR